MDQWKYEPIDPSVIGSSDRRKQEDEACTGTGKKIPILDGHQTIELRMFERKDLVTDALLKTVQVAVDNAYRYNGPVEVRSGPIAIKTERNQKFNFGIEVEMDLSNPKWSNPYSLGMRIWDSIHTWAKQVHEGNFSVEVTTPKLGLGRHDPDQYELEAYNQGMAAFRLAGHSAKNPFLCHVGSSDLRTYWEEGFRTAATSNTKRPQQQHFHVNLAAFHHDTPLSVEAVQQLRDMAKGEGHKGKPLPFITEQELLDDYDPTTGGIKPTVEVKEEPQPTIVSKWAQYANKLNL